MIKSINTGTVISPPLGHKTDASHRTIGAPSLKALFDQGMKRLFPNNPKKETQGLDNKKILEEIAKKFGIQDSHYFNQIEFKQKLCEQHPEFKKALGEEAEDGICFGLAIKWLQQRSQGKNDHEFFHALENWQDNSLLLEVLGLQMIEQKPNAGVGAKAFNVLKDSALAGGMDIAKLEGRPYLLLPTHNLSSFSNSIEQLWQRRDECHLWINADLHAMALTKDKNNKLHFFDPNCGVYSVETDKKDNLHTFMYMIISMNDMWVNKYRSLRVAELTPNENHVHSHRTKPDIETLTLSDIPKIEEAEHEPDSKEINESHFDRNSWRKALR